MDDAQRQRCLQEAMQGDSQALGRLLDSLRPYVRLLVRTLRDPRVQARLGESDLIQQVVWVDMPNDHHLTVSADGHYQGSEGIEKEIVYIVQTDKGQETLTPAEFAKRYNWKNDPSRARLTAK